MAAVFPDAGNPFAHPQLLEDEGLEPWSATETWLFGSPTPNHWVDVTESVDRQLAALREHHSQTDQMADLGGWLRGREIADAVRAQLPAGRLAEAFMRIDTGC